MSYEEKYEKAVKELQSKGLWKVNFKPWWLENYKKTGIKLKPPYYRSFISNMLWQTVNFGLVYTLIIFAIPWPQPDGSMNNLLIMSLLSAILYGVFIAIYYKCKANKNKLTPWDKL